MKKTALMTLSLLAASSLQADPGCPACLQCPSTTETAKVKAPQQIYFNEAQLMLMTEPLVFHHLGLKVPERSAARAPITIESNPSTDILYEDVKDMLPRADFNSLTLGHQITLRNFAIDTRSFDERPVFCFTPGYSEKAMAAFDKAIFGDDKFRPSGRWTTTANTVSIAQGQPFVLTYSFVPDGTPIAKDASIATETNDPSSLIAFLNGLYGNQATWQPLFTNIFDRWEELTGIDYQYESNDDGVALKLNAGVAGVRGDCRIGGHYVDGESGSNILAYNFFPNNGDMVIDTGNPTFYGNTTNNSIGMRNTLSHEHGHGLGLSHTCPMDGTKLMEPFINTGFDGPQHDDILGAQNNYGDMFESNETAGTATHWGNLVTNIGNFPDEVGVFGNLDVDYYSFSISQTGTVVVTLFPIGSTYLEGPQNGDGSCTAGTNLDTTTLTNLDVQLIGTDGTSVIATANTQPAGSTEQIIGAPLPATGTYYVKVYSSGVDEVQLYDVQVDFTPAGGFPEADVAITKDDGLTIIDPGDPITYTLVASNNGPDSADGSVVTDNLPSQVTGASWSVVYGGGAAGPASGNGNLSLNITTFPSGGTATITIDGTIDAGASAATLVNTASITQPIGVVDTNTGNNSDSDTNTYIDGPGLPNDAEEFNAFPGLSGGAPPPVANDTGTGFSLIYGGGTTTANGFAVDTVQSLNGRGLTWDGNENNAMVTSNQIGGGSYVESAHQVAFCFRIGDTTNVPLGAFTQLFTPVNKGAPFDNFNPFAYIIEVGKDGSGNVGLRLDYPNTTPGQLSTTQIVPVTPQVWHTCVIQYTSATDNNPATNNGGISIWIDPVDGNSAVTLARTAGQVTSQYGAGALSQYAFASYIFFASTDAPTVFIDSIGTWDGFGTPGVNDLEQAVNFLNSAKVDNSVDSILCLTQYTEAWGSENVAGTLSGPVKWGAIGFKHDASIDWQTIAGDFNGDELIELLTVTEYGEAWITFNSGSETFINTFNSAPGYLYLENGGWVAIPGDFDGDGFTDLAQITQYGDIWLGLNSGGAIPGPSFSSAGGVIYDPNNGNWVGAGDLNGDGNDDIIEVRAGGQVYVHTSTGAGFNPPADWGAFGFQYDRGDSVNPGYGLLVGDFNDDGRDDLMTLTPFTDAWVALSNGAGFGAPSRWNFLGFKYAPRLNNGWDIFAGDMDGDGVDDLVQLTEYGELWSATSTKSTFTSPPTKLGAIGFRSNPEGNWRSYIGRVK